MRSRLLGNCSRVAVVFCFLLAGASLLATVGDLRAASVSYAGGDDCWITTSPPSTAQLHVAAGQLTAGTRHSVDQTQTVPVLGDPTVPCACSCAAPTIQWTDRHGNPTQPGDQHAVNATVVPNIVDTCVHRADTTLNGVGTPSNADVQIKCLSLKGSISVAMDSGPNCTFNFHVGLSGAQALGQIQFTPTSGDLSKGTAVLNSLPVGAQVDYSPTNGCDAGSLAAATGFTNTQGKYSIPGGFPTLNEIGLLVLVAGMLLGMTIVLWRRSRRNVEAA